MNLHHSKTFILFIFSVAQCNGMEKIDRLVELTKEISNNMSCVPFGQIEVPSSDDTFQAESTHDMSKLISVLESRLPKISKDFKNEKLIKIKECAKEFADLYKSVDVLEFQEYQKKNKNTWGGKRIVNLAEHMKIYQRSVDAMILRYQSKIGTIESLHEIVARMKELAQTTNIDSFDDKIEANGLRQRKNKFLEEN